MEKGYLDNCVIWKFWLRDICLFSPNCFYSVIYFYQCELVSSHFMLSVIISKFLLFQWFQLWPLGAFSHCWLCPFDRPPSFVFWELSYFLHRNRVHAHCISPGPALESDFPLGLAHIIQWLPATPVPFFIKFIKRWNNACFHSTSIYWVTVVC